MFRFDINSEKRWFAERRPSSKAVFILLGILSTIWFIIRVVPKPSRAAYPCMQAAAPFAAGFITYISGLLISVAAISKLRSMNAAKNLPAAALAVTVLIGGIMMFVGGDSSTGRAETAVFMTDEPPNSPVGVARGIFPGRVVWVWNPDATDESCTNEPGDYWFQDDNADAEVIETMLSESLHRLTGEESDSLAWDALFRHYNSTHGNGNQGYMPGQKVAVKVNITTAFEYNLDLSTYEKIQNQELMDVSPQLVVVMLKQLIDIFGIAQNDIYIGDPIRHFYNVYWDRCHALYPDVHYLDRHGYLGRTKTQPTAGPAMFYSDGTVNDSLPQAFVEADYMINMACLKQHELAGGTFCAKNHYGSCCRLWAMHLHYSQPSVTIGGFENLGYGKYRNLVDFMEHKDLGEKTILFLVDGLWGGEGAESEPVRFQITPFNNDWPNSIFVSQDHVAIESVGHDFVRAEFDEYADMFGADDYLHQAADSANWAEGITYDPDNDGLLIASMGVHEHWNNDIDKEYTRNLGTGDGIELIKYMMTGIYEPGLNDRARVHPYPNPFTGRLNVEYSLASPAQVRLSLYGMNGAGAGQMSRQHQYAGTYTMHLDAGTIPPGIYTYHLEVISGEGTHTYSGKIVKAGR